MPLTKQSGAARFKRSLGSPGKGTAQVVAHAGGFVTHC